MYACIHVLCNHGKPLDACINELIEYTMWLFAWKGTTNAYLVAAVGIIYMYVLNSAASQNRAFFLTEIRKKLRTNPSYAPRTSLTTVNKCFAFNRGGLYCT